MLNPANTAQVYRMEDVYAQTIPADLRVEYDFEAFKTDIVALDPTAVESGVRGSVVAAFAKEQGIIAA